MPNTKQFELREDLITGSRVAVFVGDKKKLITKNPNNHFYSKKDKCELCNPKNSDLDSDILVYKDKTKEWTLRVVKYEDSIFHNDINDKVTEKGPYIIEYKGITHELIFNKEHSDDLDELNPIVIAEIIDGIHERYLSLMKEKEYKYIAISKKTSENNQISHPHFHLQALPFVPSQIQNTVSNNKKYYQKAKRCPHCVMIDFESEGRRERIIHENKYFLSYCPFASKTAFEICILPKDHDPSFEGMKNEEKVELAKIVKDTISRMNEVLKEPGYTLTINSAPIDGQDYNYFHWNISIVPNTPITSKFEVGEGIDICLVKPEEAAKFLREVK